jgi:hypothetical protein
MRPVHFATLGNTTNVTSPAKPTDFALRGTQILVPSKPSSHN